MMRYWTTGLAAFAALASASGHAFALSCAQPNIQQSFNWWAESKTRYYIGVGMLSPLEALPKIPDVGEISMNGGNAPDLSASYRFAGYLLDGGSNAPVDTTITVEIDCAGPWCAGFPADGTEGLMPLKIENGFDLSLQTSPCGGVIFDASTEATVRECIRAGRCAEPN